MNALDLIENDFKLLLTELKKRTPNLKDQVEKAIRIISNCKNQDPQQINQQIDALLNPLAQIFEAKQSKVYLPALNCLQKLASSFTISDTGIIMILGMLKEGSNENVDEMTQIKILQILLIFLNPNTLKVSKEFVDLVLQCSFQMFYSKSNAVKSTIQATLRQLFTIVFDKLVAKCKEVAENEDFFDSRRRLYLSAEERSKIMSKLKSVESDVIFKITMELIANLSHSLAQQDPNDKKSGGMFHQHQNIWNLVPSIHSKCMIMDIICLILNQTNDILQLFPQVLRIFENELIPVLEIMFKNKQMQQEYIVGMRLMKTTIRIINNLGIGVNLFIHILSEADLQSGGKNKGGENNLTWKSLVAFECIAISLNNPQLIKVFSQSALQVGKTVLVQVLETLIAATDNLDLSGEQSQRHMQNPLYSYQKTPKFIEATQILESELPPPTPSQIHKLIIESVCSFVENMILIFDQQGLKIGAKHRKLGDSTVGLASKMPTTHQKQQPTDIDCKDLLMLSWRPLLMALSNLLRTTSEESNMQMLLNSFQNFIGVCGSVQCYEPRDAFLESLCSFCITEQVMQPTTQQAQIQGKQIVASKDQPIKELMLTDKNVQISKTLLNIAHCLGHILDVKSWYIILETMQRIETVIKNKMKSKGAKPLTINPQQPAINQSGNQTLVEFNDIKNKVQEKMKEYNYLERFNQQKATNQKQEEEEKRQSTDVMRNSNLEEKKEVNQQHRISVTGKKGHHRMGSMSSSAAKSMMTQDSKNIQSQYETTSGSSHYTPNVSSIQIHQQPFDQLNTDLQILQDSFDSLFTSSILFDQQSLAELITSLGQLTVGVLENINSNKKLGDHERSGFRGASAKHQPNEGDILANINTFAITRLVETALVNISRIEQIWKILIAHFDILSNCKVQTLRQLSIEALLCIILEIFAYKKDKKNFEQQKNPFTNAASPTKRGSPTKRSVISQSSGDDDYSQGDLDFDVDENWSGTVWQYTILTPFSDQLKSQHQSNNLQTLKGIEKIIQTCGQQLKNDGWRIIILTISKTAELIDNDQILATGFRCLKLIVSIYIEKLSQENFITILHAIHKYAANDGDNINNNLTAIGMFQNIADYTAKLMLKDSTQQQNDQQQQQQQQFNAQRIWSILFEKVQQLGVDYRAEIRRANIYTLENIIMTHGQLFSDQVWTLILKNNLLSMLRNSIDMYSQQKGGPQQQNKAQAFEAGLPTPSFSSGGGGGWDTKKKTGGTQPKKMKFGEDEVMKALQKNNDEQWEETCLLLIQTVLRSIKKYSQLESKSTELFDYAWVHSVHTLTDIIKNGSQEICTTVYKSLEDILSQPNCISVFMNNISVSFKLLEATSEWFVQQKQETQGIVRKPNLLKLCPVIIDTLKKIYCQENLEENQFRAPYLQIIIPTYAQVLMQLLFRMMRCSKTSSDGFQGMGVPHKLVNEEKQTFEFIESLNDIFMKNGQTHLLYLKSLLQFTEYDYHEPHSEAFVRRVFSIINSIILRGKVSHEILKEIMPMLYGRIEQLINLRYNNEACMALVFPSKGSQTLFYTVGLYAMHISSFLINPKHFKSRMTAHYKQSQDKNAIQSTVGGYQNPTAASGSTGGGFTGFKKITSPLLHQHQQHQSSEEVITSNDIMFSEQLEFSIVDPSVIVNQETQDPELKQLVWDRVLPLARNHLLFSPERVAGHNKAVVEDVVKSSQDLDMQVMNFITNSLLPNCSDINDKEFQASLVHIIDNGCNSVYSSQRLSQSHTSTTSGAFGNSLSKYCLNNLFELCRYQTFKATHSSGDLVSQDQDEILDLAAQKKIYEIRKKIATITTPVLINRCRDTLRKYVADEQKSGSTTLPRQRVSEVIFILEKLKQLDCYPEVQPLQYKSKKGHLVQLMPIFADLVLSNESGLKDHLRDIFIDISEAIAQQAQGSDCRGEGQKVGDSSGGEF